MKDKEHILNSDILEQYILGLTTAEENKLVEEYASVYPEIQERIDALRYTMEEYAKQYSTPPPKGLKENIISEIEQLEKNSAIQATSMPASRNWLAIAACAATLFFGFLAFQFYSDAQQIDQKLSQLESEYQEFQTACQQIQNQQAEQQKLFALLKDEQTVPVHLSGTSLAPDAQAIVYWNGKNKKAYLNAVNLPPPPKDKQYQIWADVKGEMVNMGIFDNDRENLQAVNFIEEAESLNITLEPKGGSEHPTVALLFVNGKV